MGDCSDNIIEMDLGCSKKKPKTTYSRMTSKNIVRSSSNKVYCDKLHTYIGFNKTMS